MLKRLFLAICVGVIGSAAQSECMRALTVTFVEGAPTDRFEIIHTVTGLTLTGLRIDLAPSAGELIFDTEDGGAGVEVYQPFQGDATTRAAKVADGAEMIDVELSRMQAGQRAHFTIDVDDRMASSELGQIRVTGGELKGATVAFSVDNGDALKAVFDADNRAKVCA